MVLASLHVNPSPVAGPRGWVVITDWFVAYRGMTMSVHYRRAPEAICEQLRVAHDAREELVGLRLAYEA